MRALKEYCYFFITCEGDNEKIVFKYIIDEGRFIVDDEGRYSIDYLSTHTSAARKKLLNDIFEYSFEGPVAILSIQDRPKETWRLTSGEKKIMERNMIDLLPVVTYPEIEILAILHDDKCSKEWDKVKRKESASSFCKRYYKKNIKNGDDFLTVFSCFDEFEEACRKYSTKNQHKDVLTLYDIIKKC